MLQSMCIEHNYCKQIKSDLLIEGDIQELFDTNLKAGHAAAFSDDCDSASSKGIVRGAGNQVDFIYCICV